jgi:four helix bundle protein
MPIRSFEDLEVWRRAMDLVSAVYAASARFPMAERFGLTSQVRRAAVSVPSNIAEGHARGTRAEYVHHLAIAQGSLAEVVTQIEVARRLGYSQRDEASTLSGTAAAVAQMLHALRRALSRTPNPEPRTPTC